MRKVLSGPNSIRGFASAQAPSSLDAGLVSLLQNNRLDEGCTQVRPGDALVKGSLSGALRGSYECTLDGQPHLVRAYTSGGLVTVQISTDDGANWSSITPTSGAFGDTRLADSTTQPVRFCVVRSNPRENVTPYDLLVIQNGTTLPRVYGKVAEAGSGGVSPTFYNTGVVHQPPAPLRPIVSAKAAFDQFFTLSTDTATTITQDNAAKFSMADGSATPGRNFLTGTVDTTYTAGVGVKVTFANSVDMTNKRQLVFTASSGYASGGPADTNDSLFWSYMRVILVDGTGNLLTVYDPSSGFGTLASLPLTALGATNGLYSYAFQLGYTLPTVSATFNYASVAGIRLEYTQVTPVYDIEYGLYMIGFGGKDQGTTRFSAAYWCPQTRQIGPTTSWPPSNGELSLSGGTTFDTGGTRPFAASLQDSENFFFDYYVEIPNPAQVDLDNGCSWVYLYANQPGQIDFYLTAAQQMGGYSGAAWSYTSLAAGQGVHILPGSFFTQDFGHVDPDSDCVVLPTGTAMVTANARMFVGASSRLWFSDADQSFQFRKAVKFIDATNADFTSGGSMNFDGQVVNAIVALGSFSAAPENSATPVTGSATLHILTDRNLFQLSGFTSESLSKPLPIAPLGTLSPLTVARYTRGFYWLAQDGEVYNISAAGLRKISQYLVDDKTQDIPATRKVWACASCIQERYYLAYTRVGQTINDRTLVWNEYLGAWESEDTIRGTSEIDTGGLISYYASGYVKLLRFSNTTVYEHAQPGNTNASDWLCNFQEFMGGKERITMRGMDVMLDVVPTQVVQFTGRRYVPDTQTFDPSSGFTINTTVPAGFYRLWEKEILKVGVTGYTIQPRLTGLLAGLTKIYEIGIDITERPSGPTRT